MSLTETERQQTSAELKVNLGLTGLTLQQVAADLQFTPPRLRGTLEITDGSDPVDVWQLRDYLQQAVQDAGRQPAAYTARTDASRQLAAGWFRLRTAPRHLPATL